MSLDRLDPCCLCPEHQRIWRNEDGWVLTQDFEAWTSSEWRHHCARYGPEARSREARAARIRHNRKKAAA